MDNTEKLAIGERIRKVRTDMGLSREQLSEILNISALFLGFIECGQRGMSLDTLCSLCKATNVSADYYLFGKTENNLENADLSAALSGIDTTYLPYIVDQINHAKKLIAQVEQIHHND